MAQETKHATLEWLGDLRFAAGAPDGPKSFIDSDNASAPGPMLTLLGAAAACSATDVVEILKKKRVDLKSLKVEAAGVRREEIPRRYVSLHLIWRIVGEGIDEAKAKQAVDLSVHKYCSVMSSLAPDITITNEIHVATA
jgi:putative redox protein